MWKALSEEDTVRGYIRTGMREEQGVVSSSPFSSLIPHILLLAKKLENAFISIPN
jgi:hypothetical protein